MKTMTIRNIPDDVSNTLKALATSTNTSLNATVVQVLTSGVLPQKPRRKRRDLSRFCGGWTDEEFNEFDHAVADCERIDPEDWK